jgi:hypothetical protein
MLKRLSSTPVYMAVTSGTQYIIGDIKVNSCEGVGAFIQS